MSAFCAEHSISRKTFYAIRARAATDGPAAALQPRSRRPRRSPTQISEEVQKQALDVRAALETSGLDCGPISVMDKMAELGMTAPSAASLSRIFRARGVARLEPRKKPRSAYRRFVYPAPNCLWQLDATEYVLAQGRKCVIFQLIDDHSRYAVASLVAEAETAPAALAVVRLGIERHGVPQRLLSDNGIALNPTRRGWTGQLVAHLTTLGVEPITSRISRPTTQGKNERFHQTLFRYLDTQPAATTLAELQTQVDEFDQIYNTQRRHQGLPGRCTPQQAWDATAKAEPPTPRAQPLPPPTPGRTREEIYRQGEAERPVGSNGQATVIGTSFRIGQAYIGHHVLATWDARTITFADPRTGELIVAYPKPERGTKTVSGKHALHRGPSPMS